MGFTIHDLSLRDFFVKQGEGSQGAAIDRLRLLEARFKLGIPVGDLPSRPSPTGVVEIACGAGRRDSLREELISTNAPLIVTLGQEALDSVRGVADSAEDGQERLTPGDGYGSEGAVTINGTKLRLLPLAHPGLIRQAPNDSDWRAAHEGWAAKRA